MASDAPFSSDDPSRATRPGRVPGAAEPEARNLQLRILVVDDLADAADSLAILLRILGHEVRTAYDGAAAITTAEQFQPHAVLLDIGLPKLDGYQVAQRLRQMPLLQSACLIAISGYGRDSDIEQAYRAGFDLHLLKPVSAEQLTALLAELASRLT
jgi:two-component system, sensor histidine kinase